jgi:hypothetical protein
MNLNKLKFILLFIIPIVILLNINYNNKTEFAYDPNYIYLFNGLNLATHFGKMGHYDNPGTPVSVFSAIIMRTAHLFRNTDKDLASDVILNPQYYVKTIVWTMAVVNAIVLLLFGLFISKTTNSLVYGLLFQSIPFLSASVFHWSFQTLSPETVLIGAVSIFVIIFLWKYCFNKDLGEFKFKYSKKSFISIDKFFILFGIIFGFLLATKINTLPLLLIPFIFVPTIRNKFIFLVITSISFFIFTLPIVKYYPDLLLWVIRILDHTDLYGSGESGFVNLNLFKDHFVTALESDPLIFLIIGLSVIFLIIRMVQKKFDIHFKILLTLILVQLIDLFMVMKHFNMHYLIPVLPTLVVNIFIMLQVIKLPKIGRTSVVLPFVLVSIYLNIHFSKYVPTEYQEVKTINDINIYSFGCKSAIYGLRFGDERSNGVNSAIFEKICGKQYFYDVWTQKLTTWQDTLTIDSLTKLNKKIYLYAYDGYLKDWPTPFNLKLVAEGQYLIETTKNDSLLIK